MSSPDPELIGFAYGEQVDSIQQRSLGYRLLVPSTPESWSQEVEALARRLQATAYSDHWPPTDLFCSVLLADGRRIVAVARYGLADHTPGQRRGGLELVGVVGAADWSVDTALTVYEGLKRQRAGVEDLHAFGKRLTLGGLTAGVQPKPAPADPLPVLPVRLWQDGAFLFAAGAPSDPDHHLRLLEQNSGQLWQWLPLVGPDFPLASYAQRGPLIAWTPHLAGVALKIDRKSPELALKRRAGSPLGRAAVGATALVLVSLLAANLWSTLRLHHDLAASNVGAPPTVAVDVLRDTRPAPATPAAVNGNESRERFAAALAKLLRDRGAMREGDANRTRMLARYDRLARERENLRLGDADADGKVAVALVSVLADRSADRVEEVMQKALAKRGFDDRLVKLACEYVREQLAAEGTDEH
jgi:hypothetical protein